MRFLDAPHSWTYVNDAARTLVAATGHEEAWGRAWHVPSVSALPARQLTTHLASLAGAPAPQLARISAEELRQIGLRDSVMAEVSEMLYLFEHPFIMDSSRTEQTFNLHPGPLDQALTEMARAVAHASAAARP